MGERERKSAREREREIGSTRIIIREMSSVRVRIIIRGREGKSKRSKNIKEL